MKLREVSRIKVGGAPRTVVLTAKSVVVGDPDAGLAIYARATKKRVAALPAGTLQAVSPSASLGVMVLEGATRAGRYAWAVELWDLARGKRVAALARCTPDDQLDSFVLTDTAVWAIRTEVSGAARTWSLVKLDHAGKQLASIALATKVAPFHLALGGSIAVWAYFDGKAGIVENPSGKQAPLAGGALRVGRRHELGISELALASSGEFALAASSGAKRVIVWDLATRKAAAGPWATGDAKHARFLGHRVCWWADGSELHVAPVTGGPAQTMRTGGPGRLAPLGDDRHVVWAGATGFELWDVAAARRVATLKARHPVTCLDAAGSTIVAGDDHGEVVVVDAA